MDMIIFVYHLLFLCRCEDQCEDIFHPVYDVQSYEGKIITSSACYGPGIPECYWLHLTCDPDQTIEIVEAKYRYNDTSEGCDSTRNNGICTKTMVSRCCSPKENDVMTNFTTLHLSILTVSCYGNQTCEMKAVQGPVINGKSSSSVVVRYTCRIVDENTTETGHPQTNDIDASADRTSAAVVVVPIVIVLLCLGTGVVAFLYWRRRRTTKSSQDEKENRTPDDVNPGIQNKNYYMTESEKVNGDVSEQEDTYHTIDADSIPDLTTNYNEYSELETAETYESLDPRRVEKDDLRQYDNKVLRTTCLDNVSVDGDNNNELEHASGIATNEYFILESEEDPNNQQKDPKLVATDNTVTQNNDVAPTSNDYFILEPERVPSDQQNGQILNADIDSTEYNTITPQTNKIVKDPRYQRLGAIQH